MAVCTGSWVIRKHVCLHNSTQLSLYLFLYLSGFMLFCWGLFIHVLKSIYFIYKYLSKFIIFVDNIQTHMIALNDCETPFCKLIILYGYRLRLFWMVLCDIWNTKTESIRKHGKSTSSYYLPILTLNILEKNLKICFKKTRYSL